MMSKTKKNSSFHSKILLFGEYSLIQNSMGLSMPYSSYKGKLSFIDPKNSQRKERHSNSGLKAYLKYLKDLCMESALIAEIDIDRLEKEINGGLYFDSDIPQSFGVGSSGALVAAIYHRYAKNKFERNTIRSDDILQLKEILGQMESHYHGKSSGFDPLVCYLNLPLLIKSKINMGPVDMLRGDKKGNGAIFLIDTGAPGRTQPLVQWFLDKCREQDFHKLFHEKFIPCNDRCIKNFLKGETKALFYNLYHVSKFLLENFHPMIPQLFRKVWEKGLETKAYYLKLCGSGGGGFLLGFTENLELAREYLGDHQIKVIHKF